MTLTYHEELSIHSQWPVIAYLTPGGLMSIAPAHHLTPGGLMSIAPVLHLYLLLHPGVEVLPKS
jgi:hypothetical protein